MSGPIEGEWIVEFVDIERDGDDSPTLDKQTKDTDTSDSSEPKGPENKDSEKESPDAHTNHGVLRGMPVINYYVRPIGKEPIPLDVSGVPQRELDSIRGFEWVRVTTEDSDDPKITPLGEFVSHVEVVGFPAAKSTDSSSKESSEEPSKESSASPDKRSAEGSSEDSAWSKESSKPASSDPVSSEDPYASWPDDNPDDLTSSDEP